MGPWAGGGRGHGRGWWGVEGVGWCGLPNCIQSGNVGRPRPLKTLPGLNGDSHPLNLGSHQESTQRPSCLSVCVIALLLQLPQECARMCRCVCVCMRVHVQYFYWNIILQRLILLSLLTLWSPFDISYILFPHRATLI